ncbi:MAG: sugar ABC transporter substrate-binding protein [Armatimonadetes bacterium]|nr:sugar ABC transporter substrate-binding protein [Armatimonadota bacterium]
MNRPHQHGSDPGGVSFAWPPLVVLAALTIVLALTAPAVAQNKPDKKQPVTITYWCSPYPNEAGWAITMTRLWNQTHPNIRVRLQAIPQGRLTEDVLTEAIKNRTTPDVCSHLFPVNVHEFVGMGGLLPLDSFPQLIASARKRSGDAALSGFRSPDGKLYQLPWKCNPIMLQYNAGLLKKLGLKPPRTYGEFLAVGDALRKRDIYAWAPNPSDKFFKRYYDFYPLYFAAAAGHPFLDGRGGPAFKNTASVAVMDFLRECFRRGYAPRDEMYQNDAALNEAFASGKIAFLVTGPWNIPMIEEIAGNTVQFSFIPVPVPDSRSPAKPTYTYGNFRNIGIFSNTKHRAEAAQFAEFLISRQSDVAFLEMCSELPYRLDLLTDPSFTTLLKQNPYLGIFARQLANVRSVENAPYFNKVLGAISKQYVECAVQGRKASRQGVIDAAAEVTRMN